MKHDAKILFFDIESTHLKADFGTILCCGYKWAHEKKVHVPSIMDYPGWEKEPWNEKRLMQDLYKVLASADVWVTYFGKRFDVPFITTKLLEHKLPLLPLVRHIDLFFTVKFNTALSRKRLQTVSEFLGLEAQKTPVIGTGWKKAMCGDKKSIKYVIDHCKADVLILEEAYERLRPLVRQHPRVSLTSRCASCGSDHVTGRGKTISGARMIQRFQCQSCGSWGQEKVS